LTVCASSGGNGLSSVLEMALDSIAPAMRDEKFGTTMQCFQKHYTMGSFMHKEWGHISSGIPALRQLCAADDDDDDSTCSGPPGICAYELCNVYVSI